MLFASSSSLLISSIPAIPAINPPTYNINLYIIRPLLSLLIVSPSLLSYPTISTLTRTSPPISRLITIKRLFFLLFFSLLFRFILLYIIYF